MSEGCASVILPDGRTVEVTIERDLRCRTHGGQPGWGCEGCRDIVNAIVGFKPTGGWLEPTNNDSRCAMCGRQANDRLHTDLSLGEAHQFMTNNSSSSEGPDAEG
jgi:hypothetical protein